MTNLRLDNVIFSLVVKEFDFQLGFLLAVFDEISRVVRPFIKGKEQVENYLMKSVAGGIGLIRCHGIRNA